MSRHEQRRGRLLKAMAQAGSEAFVVTSPPDVRYFSGFSGSNGALLLMPERVVLATDGRYRVQAQQESPDVDVLITRALLQELLTAAHAHGVTRVGFDPGAVSVAVWRRTMADVPQVEFEAADIDVAGLRQVKDDGELAALRKACRISTEALADLLTQIQVGMTEIEVARLLEMLMGRRGAPDRAFDSIVAGGPHSAIPHHQPGERPLSPGDLLKIDFGAAYDGYHADCTRTFVVAAEPTDWQTRIHAVVLRAQQAGMAALRPGVSGREVDRIARSVIEDAGYGQYYGHGLGHGVGLEIHEVPFLGQNSTHTVEARVPLTVEPGIYLPDRGGVRIEDTVIVLDSGIEILTDFPRELARVG
jgi:Xaa-Pro aminopeptidase